MSSVSCRVVESENQSINVNHVGMCICLSSSIRDEVKNKSIFSSGSGQFSQLKNTLGIATDFHTLPYGPKIKRFE